MMAPIAITNTPVHVEAVNPITSLVGDTNAKGHLSLKLSGILDQYEHSESTPIIGREYPSIQIKDLLHDPNSDDLLRELAIISEYYIPLSSYFLY